MRLIVTLWFAIAIAGLVGSVHAQPVPSDLESLRERSLELVNQARTERGLPPLDYTETLNEAADAHARDMLARDYYSHRSPEGENVRDRYLAAGGQQWRVIRENIARCAGCPAPGLEAVKELHEGWMNSPGHRKNILAEGLDGYGFGIAHDDGRRLAVQTFAGQGTEPAELVEGEPEPLDPEAQTELAADLINEARGSSSVSPAPALVEHVASILPDGSHDQVELGELDVLSGLPAGLRYRQYRALFARCGGCGATPTDADVHSFIDQWREGSRSTLLQKSLSAIGMAIAADGRGSKIAVAILAGP